MKSSLRIYVVLSTILILEASATAQPYVPYQNSQMSNQNRLYFNSQRNTPLLEVKNQVQQSNFQPDKNWASRRYQNTGNEPRVYNNGFTVPNVYPQSGFPNQPPANSFGSTSNSASTDSFQVQPNPTDDTFSDQYNKEFTASNLDPHSGFPNHLPANIFSSTSNSASTDAFPVQKSPPVNTFSDQHDKGFIAPNSYPQSGFSNQLPANTLSSTSNSASTDSFSVQQSPPVDTFSDQYNKGFTAPNLYPQSGFSNQLPPNTLSSTSNSASTDSFSVQQSPPVDTFSDKYNKGLNAPNFYPQSGFPNQLPANTLSSTSNSASTDSFSVQKSLPVDTFSDQYNKGFTAPNLYPQSSFSNQVPANTLSSTSNSASTDSFLVQQSPPVDTLSGQYIKRFTAPNLYPQSGFSNQLPANTLSSTSNSASADSFPVQQSPPVDTFSDKYNKGFTAPNLYPQSGFPNQLPANTFSSISNSEFTDSFSGQPSPPVDTFSDPSKFKIIPIPISEGAQMIRLPLSGVDSNIKIFRVTPEGQTKSNDHSRVLSSDTLEALSKAESVIDKIESNPGSYIETFKLAGEQQPALQTSDNTGQTLPNAYINSEIKGETYEGDTANSYLKVYENPRTGYDDDLATHGTNSSPGDHEYNREQSNLANIYGKENKVSIGGTSLSNSQTVANSDGSTGNQNGLNVDGTYPSNNLHTLYSSSPLSNFQTWNGVTPKQQGTVYNNAEATTTTSSSGVQNTLNKFPSTYSPPLLNFQTWNGKQDHIPNEQGTVYNNAEAAATVITGVHNSENNLPTSYSPPTNFQTWNGKPGVTSTHGTFYNNDVLSSSGMQKSLNNLPIRYSSPLTNIEAWNEKQALTSPQQGNVYNNAESPATGSNSGSHTEGDYRNNYDKQGVTSTIEGNGNTNTSATTSASNTYGNHGTQYNTDKVFPSDFNNYQNSGSTESTAISQGLDINKNPNKPIDRDFTLLYPSYTENSPNPILKTPSNLGILQSPGFGKLDNDYSIHGPLSGGYLNYPDTTQPIDSNVHSSNSHYETPFKTVTGQQVPAVLYPTGDGYGYQSSPNKGSSQTDVRTQTKNPNTDSILGNENGFNGFEIPKLLENELETHNVAPTQINNAETSTSPNSYGIKNSYDSSPANNYPQGLGPQEKNLNQQRTGYNDVKSNADAPNVSEVQNVDDLLYYSKDLRGVVTENEGKYNADVPVPSHNYKNKMGPYDTDNQYPIIDNNYQQSGIPGEGSETLFSQSYPSIKEDNLNNNKMFNYDGSYLSGNHEQTPLVSIGSPSDSEYHMPTNYYTNINNKPSEEKYTSKAAATAVTVTKNEPSIRQTHDDQHQNGHYQIHRPINSRTIPQQNSLPEYLLYQSQAAGATAEASSLISNGLDTKEPDDTVPILDGPSLGYPAPLGTRIDSKEDGQAPAKLYPTKKGYTYLGNNPSHPANGWAEPVDDSTQLKSFIDNHYDNENRASGIKKPTLDEYETEDVPTPHEPDNNNAEITPGGNFHDYEQQYKTLHPEKTTDNSAKPNDAVSTSGTQKGDEYLYDSIYPQNKGKPDVITKTSNMDKSDTDPIAKISSNSGNQNGPYNTGKEIPINKNNQGNVWRSLFSQFFPTINDNQPDESNLSDNNKQALFKPDESLNDGSYTSASKSYNIGKEPSILENTSTATAASESTSEVVVSNPKVPRHLHPKYQYPKLQLPRIANKIPRKTFTSEYFLDDGSQTTLVPAIASSLDLQDPESSKPSPANPYIATDEYGPLVDPIYLPETGYSLINPIDDTTYIKSPYADSSNSDHRYGGSEKYRSPLEDTVHDFSSNLAPQKENLKNYKTSHDLLRHPVNPNKATAGISDHSASIEDYEDYFMYDMIPSTKPESMQGRNSRKPSNTLLHPNTQANAFSIVNSQTPQYKSYLSNSNPISDSFDTVPSKDNPIENGYTSTNYPSKNNPETKYFSKNHDNDYLGKANHAANNAKHPVTNTLKISNDMRDNLYDYKGKSLISDSLSLTSNSVSERPSTPKRKEQPFSFHSHFDSYFADPSSQKSTELNDDINKPSDGILPDNTKKNKMTVKKTPYLRHQRRPVGQSYEDGHLENIKIDIPAGVLSPTNDSEDYNEPTEVKSKARFIVGKFISYLGQLISGDYDS